MSRPVNRYDLYRDDKLILRAVSYIEIMDYIHANHCYSTAHALAFEGYRFADAAPATEEAC